MSGQSEDRKSYDDDFGEMLRLRAEVWKHDPESDEANAMNARADQLAFALSAYLVARELPGVEFPPPETKEYGSVMCGGRAPDIRDACEELVWLYGFRADAGGADNPPFSNA
jgi:hypothetical protein